MKSETNYELCITNYELKRKRLHVSPKESLKECVVASGFPYDKATHPANNIREAGGVVIPLCDNRKISIIAGPEALVKELEVCLSLAKR